MCDRKLSKQSNIYVISRMLVSVQLILNYVHLNLVEYYIFCYLWKQNHFSMYVQDLNILNFENIQNI